MGGDDPDLSLFQDSTAGLVDTVKFRDRWELKLIRTKLNSINSANPGKHRIVGICRGAQFIARAMGYEINADTPNHAKKFKSDRIEKLHPIQILKTTKSFLMSLFDGKSILVA